jgi:glycosyltransferase 2 family protein
MRLRPIRAEPEARTALVILKRLSVLIPVIMLPLGLWLGYRAFHEYSLAEIAASVTAIPSTRLATALACAAASYLCLTGFDALAVRYVGRRLAYRSIALTSFVSLSIGHNVGVAALSSGTLRYRFYSGFGFSAFEVGKIILFCGATVGLGLISLGGLVSLLRPDLAAGLIGLPKAAVLAIGILCAALVGGYVLLAWRVRRPLSIRGHSIGLPTTGIAAAQVAVGTANFAFVAAALYQLMAAAAHYSEVVAAYVLGNATAILSHVPGGLGVLEYVIASLVVNGQVVGALIVFRIVYFLIPLVLGSLLLSGAELVRWRANGNLGGDGGGGCRERREGA